MGLRNDGFAKVWEVKTRAEKYTDAKISVSKKNKQTGAYDTDFSGIVRFIGEAHKKAFEFAEGSKIKILSCDTTNNYNKETKTTFWRCIIFDFEFSDDSPKSAPKNTQQDFVDVNLDEMQDLPFN